MTPLRNTKPKLRLSMAKIKVKAEFSSIDKTNTSNRRFWGWFASAEYKAKGVHVSIVTDVCENKSTARQLARPTAELLGWELEWEEKPP